jgi:hypothetical protein
MPYPEKRKGKITGRWYGRVRLKTGDDPNQKPRVFDSKKEALAYEEYVHEHGCEPASVASGSGVARPGFSFAEVADRCLDKGGPKGVWRKDDVILTGRLAVLKSRIGTWDIAKITRAVINMELVTWLEKRKKPGSRNHFIGPATINRYIVIAHGVLTWAHDQGHARSIASVQAPERGGGPQDAGRHPAGDRGRHPGLHEGAGLAGRGYSGGGADHHRPQAGGAG